MKLELVSCSHVNGLQYYDVHFWVDGTMITLVPVLYSSIDYCWYVKLPDRPLFVTFLYSELINYLCTIIRELYNL